MNKKIVIKKLMHIYANNTLSMINAQDITELRN